MKNIWKYTLHKRTTTTSILFLTIIVLLAVVIPYVSPYSDDLNGAVHLEINNQAPSFSHIFGTDSAGRDMFTLTIRGGLVSLRVAIGVVLMSVVLGVPLGFIAGVSSKWVDETIMRISDAFLAFPPFVLPIVIAIALGGSSIKDFSSSNGKKGLFQQHFSVYGREGEKCSKKKCHNNIIKIVIAKRASFYCAKCQK